MQGVDADPGFEREKPRAAAVLRLEAALDRISGALVRRLEHDAVRADLHPGDDRRDDDGPDGARVDDDRIDEVRAELDILIARLRAAIGDDDAAGA